MARTKPLRVGIVYHCIPHYRKSIFQALMQQDSLGLEYKILADAASPTSSIRAMGLAEIRRPVAEGGLRWQQVKNHWLLRRFLWQSGVIRVALASEYDVLIFEGDAKYLSTWVAAVLARLSGKRVLMWTHGILKRDQFPKSVIRRGFYRLAHALCVYNHRSRDNCIEQGFSPKRLYVVYNSLDHGAQVRIRASIDDVARERTRAELFSAPRAPLIIFTGRLTAKKKIPELVRAVQRLDESGIRANLLIIGDGPDKANVLAAISAAGLAGRVRLWGACYDETQLGRLISSADVCVAPGEIGLTAVHALGYGTPCITHDDPSRQGPEVELIIPGKTGMLFRRDDWEDLTNKMQAWLSIGRDRDAVRKLCWDLVDRYYTPQHQCEILNAAVEARSADVYASEKSSFAV